MSYVTAQHIETVSGKCGGKPCIVGTRIRVWDIYVASEHRSMTPDQIIAEYPSLGLAQVHAALAYFWDNQETIISQMKEADEFVESMKSAAGLGPLAQKLRNSEQAFESIVADDASDQPKTQ